jgi:hypothetical protein
LNRLHHSEWLGIRPPVFPSACIGIDVFEADEVVTPEIILLSAESVAFVGAASYLGV